MVEFAGFVSLDFDFFKKKDKMSKEEYERNRNDVKLHFRAVLYELQKIYHSNNGGFLELDREFQSFNKKSTNIAARHRIKDKKHVIILELNADNFSINLNFPEDEILASSEVLKGKKDSIIDFLMGSKYYSIVYSITQKGKEGSIFKLNSLEASKKNYDNFVDNLIKNLKDGKTAAGIGFRASFFKNECLKQGKNIINTFYEVIEAYYKLLKVLE